MNASLIFADHRFRVECSRIVLTQSGGSQLQVVGPGEIWQDESGVLQFKIFTSPTAYASITAHISQHRMAGQLLPDADFFDLQAEEFGNPIWTARRIFPSTRGGMQAGIVEGSIHELNNAVPLPNTPTIDTVKVIFRGKVNFPCNKGTETIIRIDGRDVRTTSSLNVAFVDSGQLHFEAHHEENHTTVSVQGPVGFLNDLTPARIHETFQFITGKELSQRAVESWCGGVFTTKLVSPWASHGDGKMQPPLQFNRMQNGNHVWRMFCDYFQYIHTDTTSGWHPVSSYLGSVVEATAASIGTESLALGVAVEGLAGHCFSSLVSVSPAFLSELDLVQAAVDTVSLSDQGRRRISGTIQTMRSVRNSDALKAFISNSNLPQSLYRSWQSIRNSSAHGANSRERDLEKLVSLKDEVLSLLYSLTLETIKYAGPRTDYSQDNWPETDWPIPQAEATMTS